MFHREEYKDRYKVLFIDVCIRKNRSRSRKLLEVAKFEVYSHIKKQMMQTRELIRQEMNYVDYNSLRERLIKSGDGRVDDEIFELAREFAKADLIFIGTPCWDFSFPALLKIYLEQICVRDITYRIDSKGKVEGMCKASHMVYLVTRGRDFSGEMEKFDHGLSYVRDLSKFLGIKHFRSVAVNNLDIMPNDVETLMIYGVLELKDVCKEIFEYLKEHGVEIV